MEKNYAIVINGIVQNVIVWDGISDYAPAGTVIEIPEGQMAWIGLGYAEGIFEQPPIEEIPQ